MPVDKLVRGSLLIPIYNFALCQCLVQTLLLWLDHGHRKNGLTLLLDLPSESKGKNLVYFIQCHCPLNKKAKLPTAGNFSLK